MIAGSTSVNSDRCAALLAALQRRVRLQSREIIGQLSPACYIDAAGTTTSCGSEGAGRVACLCTASDLGRLADAVADGTLSPGSVLDDFLQVYRHGDKTALALLVFIDRMVDAEPSIPARVAMLRNAARRAAVLFPGDASGWKRVALQGVVDAEVAMLDSHTRRCVYCTLVHRWQSWAASFVLLLPSAEALRAVEPAALALHALLAMLGDDALDYSKDLSESCNTVFTLTMAPAADRGPGPAVDSTPGAQHTATGAQTAAAAGSVAELPFLSRLLGYVAAAIETLPPTTAAPDSGEMRTPVAAAAAAATESAAASMSSGDTPAERLPVAPERTAADVLGRALPVGNAVAWMAYVRLSMVLLRVLARVYGASAAEAGWAAWFAPAHAAPAHAAADCSGASSAPASCAGDGTGPVPSPADALPPADRRALAAVLSIPEETFTRRDREALEGAMDKAAWASQLPMLRTVLIASDEELGDSPSMMTLMWTAALLQPSEHGEEAPAPESAGASQPGASDDCVVAAAEPAVPAS
jgi:hypothetical protein